MSSSAKVGAAIGRSGAQSGRHGGLQGLILRQGGIQLAGRLINGFGAVFVVALLTRYLGRDTYGEYAFLTAYVSLFYVVVDAGTQAIAVREMARNRADAPNVAGQLLTVKMVLAILAILIAVAIVCVAPVSTFASPGVRLGALVASIALLAAPFMGAAQAVFQVALRMTIPAAADILTRFVSLGLLAALFAGLLLAKSGAATRLEASLLATSIGLFAGAAFAFFGARRLSPISFRYQRARVFGLVRDAVPVAAITVLGLVHYRIDIVLLTIVSSKGNVALYSVATKVLDVSLAGLAVYMALVFPILSRLWSEDSERLGTAFRRALDFVLIVGMAGALVVNALAPFIVHVLTTHAFEGAIQPLRIISWAIPITFVETVLSQMVIAANRQLRAVPVIALATALNIGLNLWLIPALGASAPALVTDISEGVACLGLLVLLARQEGLLPSAVNVMKIVLSAAAAGVALFAALHFSTIGALVVGGLVYVVMLLALRVVALKDAIEAV